MMVSNDIKKNTPIVCSICRNEIVDRSRLYQEKTNFSIVCSVCKEKFSEEDLKIVSGLFLAYRGYFGMSDRNLYSIGKNLGELIKQQEELGTLYSVEELNMKMFHNALLFGLTPEEFRDELREYTK